MDKDVEIFMAVTGASHSEALRKLEEHGGNLNAAVDAFFNESENIPPQERHDEIPLNSRTEDGEPTRGQFLNHRSFRSVDPFWAPFNSVMDLHKRLFHEDRTFYNSSGSDQMKNTREILIDWKQEDHGGLPRINRVPHRPTSCSGPEVSHPKEVREIVIEWKENNAESSHAPHAPIIEEIPEDEHGVYEAGLEGNVTVVDDDIPSSASTVPGDGAYANISGGDSTEGAIQITELPVTSYKEDYDQEEKMLQAAIEASKTEAEASKGRQLHDFTQGAVGSRVDQCDEIVSAVSLSTKEAGRLHEAKVASVPPEPPVEVEDAVNLLVRMPDGTTCCCRFLGSNKLQSLFDFIDVAGGAKPGNYSLVRYYPRRMFTRKEGNYTLNELGLTNKQEALFLESL